MTRGYSYQEADRNQIGKLAKGSNAAKMKNKEEKEEIGVGVKASKIKAQKRDIFKTK